MKPKNEETPLRVYNAHEKAFATVAAYVVTDRHGDKVATVAFKFAKSGLRTTCYLHVIGLPMVSSFASGGGYDKCSAAAHAATKRVMVPAGSGRPPCVQELLSAIKDEGRSWEGDLRAAGFNVLQAV